MKTIATPAPRATGRKTLHGIIRGIGESVNHLAKDSAAERKAYIDAKVEYSETKNNHLVLKLDYTPYDNRTSLNFSTLELDLSYKLVQIIGEQLRNRNNANFTGEARFFPKKSFLNIGAQVISELEGELLVGNTQYHVQFSQGKKTESSICTSISICTY